MIETTDMAPRPLGYVLSWQMSSRSRTSPCLKISDSTFWKKMPADTTVLDNGVNGRALAVAVVTDVNVGRSDVKLGFNAVAFAALVKAAVVDELDTLLRPMKVGVPSF